MFLLRRSSWCKQPPKYFRWSIRGAVHFVYDSHISVFRQVLSYLRDKRLIRISHDQWYQRFQGHIFAIIDEIERTLHMPILSICMGLVIVARPIVTFHQTTDLVSWYPSHKVSAKIYLLNPNNSNLVWRVIVGRLGVRDLHPVLAHGVEENFSPDEEVFILRIIYHYRRLNLAQELDQSCGMSYHG